MSTPLLTVETACTTTGCRCEGVARRVMVRTVAVGVAEVPTLVCLACGGLLPVVLGGVVDRDEESEMAKITVHGGPTNRHDDDPAAPATVERDHPGTGRPMAGIDAPTDGTVHELAGGGTGEALPPIDVPVEAEGDDTEPEAEPAAATLPRPATNAAKADWLAYAQVLHPGEDLGGFTKADLIELCSGGG